MKKNTASQTWTVFAFDRTDNTPKTGDAAQITAKIKIDGGSLTATDDTNPTEVEDGFYEFTLTQAETNGDKLFLTPESSTSNIQVVACPAVIYTDNVDAKVAYLIKEIMNQKEITTANGNTTLYDDDSSTPLYTVAAAYYSTSTKKIRKRLA